MVAGVVDVLEKTTVPVGFAGVVPALNAGVTVAVKATCWLTPEGLGEEPRLVVVVEAVTTSSKVPGTPARKF
jgi:hypothetical protein